MPVTDGLVLHLQADELNLSDGDSVTVWESTAPATASAAQGTAAQAPTFVANAVNGEPAVRFDGTDDSLILNENLFAATDLSKTVFALVNTDDFIGHVIGASGADDFTGIGFGLGIAADKAFFKANDVAGPFVLAPSYPFEMAPRLFAARVANDAIELITGCNLTESTAPAPADLTQSSIGGAAEAGRESLAGEIPELIVYNRVLTDQELEAVRDYLSLRYGAYAAPIVDADADGIFDACDTGSRYLSGDDITVTVLEPNALEAGSLPANFVDVTSATAFDPHTNQTHIWSSGSQLRARLEFTVPFDIEQVHFWNFTGEAYDVDTLTLAFHGADDQLIEEVSFSPETGFERILAEDFTVNVSGASYVIMTAVGTNDEAEFQNIGFSGSPAQ